DVDRALGLGNADEPMAGSASTPPSQYSTAPEPPRSNGAPSQPGGVCATACNALASMERATQRLCGISGDSDPRCLSARSRVNNATAKVQASCPACAAR